MRPERTLSKVSVETLQRQIRFWFQELNDDDPFQDGPDIEEIEEILFLYRIELYLRDHQHVPYIVVESRPELVTDEDKMHFLLKMT